MWITKNRTEDGRERQHMQLEDEGGGRGGGGELKPPLPK
jgi:hypothetical protein